MANLSKDAYSSGQYSFFGNYFLGRDWMSWLSRDLAEVTLTLRFEFH